MKLANFLKLAHRNQVRAQHAWVMAMDVLIVLAAYYLVLMFRYAGTTPEWHAWTSSLAIFAAIAVVVHLAINWLTGIYTIINRYMSLVQAVRVAQAGILSTAVLFIVVVTWPLYANGGNYLVPRSVVVGGGVLALIVMIGVRFSRRVLHEVIHKIGGATERLLLVGAGQAWFFPP